MRYHAAVFGFGVLVALAATAHAESNNDDRQSLQRRLTDAGCWSGAVDGRASSDFDAAIKACPDMRPILRVETGNHSALIRAASADAQCRVLATASDDKTIRLWSMPEGKLMRIVRYPVDQSNGGQIYAVGLSPDGATLVSGGWSAQTGKESLAVLDLPSGTVRHFGVLDNVVNSIAFSPDGSMVAAGTHWKGGVHVFDVASGREVMSDMDYGDTVYGLTYGPDGSLYATSYDGKVRRYGPDMKLAAKRASPHISQPLGIAVDPAGRRVVIGATGSAAVDILDARSLNFIAQADTSDVKDSEFSKVRWSVDGQYFYAGGSANLERDGIWYRYLRKFTPDGRRVGEDAPAAIDTILDIKACGAGLVYVAADPAWGTVSTNGQVRMVQTKSSADMRDKTDDGLMVSADATRVRFGFRYGARDPVLFDLASASMKDAPKADFDLTKAKIDGLPVTSWRHEFDPKFDGRKLPTEDHERARSLAVKTDNSGFALGENWHLRAYDSSGKELWSKATPGTVWGVNFDSTGQIVVIAQGDGTLRWHRWSDGQELLAYYVEPKSRRWIAWTPAGYYMASPGAEDLIGWHLNRGWNQLADFFPASRFSQRFHRPDVVQAVLRTRDEMEALRQGNELSKRHVDVKPLTAQLPPVLTIVTPTGGGKFSGETVEIAYSVRSPSGLPIDRVEALVDGRPIEARGLARIDATRGDVKGDAEVRRVLIPVPDHDVEVSLIARSGPLVGEAATIRLAYGGEAKSRAADALVLKPKLYAVTIGVSDYADPNLRLTYPAEDARAMAETLKKQQGGMYSSVEVKTLTDREATRTGVISALKWLGKQATSRDVAMVLIAGHGHNDEQNNYWFLPADVDAKDIESTSISQDDIMRQLRGVYGKTLLFLDTCHANQAVAGVATRGGVDVNGFVSEMAKAENGLIVFSSSQGRELSQESAQWKHGAFTYALLEGFAGKADLLHDGSITVSELDVYVAERVKSLTNGAQHPVMSRPKTVQDFPFAVPR